MGTETVSLVEKNYDLEKFITNKKEETIDKKIENVNTINFDEIFSNIDIDEEITKKIKSQLKVRDLNHIIEEKKIDKNGFLFYKIKIGIEKKENDSSIITINGVKITGNFLVIKTHKIIYNKHYICGGTEEKFEERESYLDNNESDIMSDILSKEINKRFNDLIN